MCKVNPVSEHQIQYGVSCEGYGKRWSRRVSVPCLYMRIYVILLDMIENGYMAYIINQ